MVVDWCVEVRSIAFKAFLTLDWGGDSIRIRFKIKSEFKAELTLSLSSNLRQLFLCV